MGLTVLTLEVANAAAPDQREPVEFLIDSGAVYSFVPRDILARLDIQPHSRQKFRLADGSMIDRDRGDALFFYRGQRGAAPVIFGEPGDATLLGAVSLESLGFVLDAIRRDLLPLPMVVAGTPPLTRRHRLPTTTWSSAKKIGELARSMKRRSSSSKARPASMAAGVAERDSSSS